MASFKIIWSKQARNALKTIFDYYKEKSQQGAKNVKSDLLEGPKKIHFSKQYQLDNINHKYRRMVVRDYKILYEEVGGTIYVLDIISTRQSPDTLKSK